MNKQQKNIHFEALHARLATQFDTDSDVIQRIRNLSIGRNFSQNQIKKYTIDYINKKTNTLKALEKQIVDIKKFVSRREKLLLFVNQLDNKDFIEITRKDL